MRFQHQQKGLFTFYREQLQLDEEDQQARRRVSEQPTKKKKKKPKVRIPQLIQAQVKLMQPVANREQKHYSPPVPQCRRYGEAVAIFDRKNTEYITSQRKQESPPPQQELGNYLENKNISFQAPGQDSSQPLVSFRKQHLKRNDRKCYSQLKQHTAAKGSTTKLPALARTEQEEVHRGSCEIKNDLKNKISGSLLRTNGTELARHIRSQVLGGQSVTEGSSKGVSYFQFNRDHQTYLESARAAGGGLSGQQRKLLELMGRYRRFQN